MKIVVSISSGSIEMPNNYNEEWRSPVDLVQRPLCDRSRGMKRRKRKKAKYEGAEMDLQPTFGMEAGFK